MQTRGRTIILAVVVLSVGMAAAAWWFQYRQTRLTAKFWGAEAARLIVGRGEIPEVAILKLKPGRQTVDQLISNWEVEATHMLTGKPGLVHFRHALTYDDNFLWDERRQEPTSSDESWPYALEFDDGDRQMFVLVGPGFERIGKLDAANKQVDVLPCPRLGPVMMQYLSDVGVKLEDEETSR